MQLPRTLRKSLPAMLALLLLAWAAAAYAQIPDRFTNLKVVPKDVSKKELVDTMKAFTFALGTRCWYCHKGEGDDLSTFDFAADVKPTKDVARKHYEMTREINEKYFGGQAKVNCMTCHQGQAKPAG